MQPQAKKTPMLLFTSNKLYFRIFSCQICQNFRWLSLIKILPPENIILLILLIISNTHEYKIATHGFVER